MEQALQHDGTRPLFAGNPPRHWRCSRHSQTIKRTPVARVPMSVPDDDKALGLLQTELRDDFGLRLRPVVRRCLRLPRRQDRALNIWKSIRAARGAWSNTQALNGPRCAPDARFAALRKAESLPEPADVGPWRPPSVPLAGWAAPAAPRIDRRFSPSSPPREPTCSPTKRGRRLP